MSEDSGKRASANGAEDARVACEGCGYMMRGGSMCGDCREYGPPRDWRWQYDPATDRHAKVARASAQSAERASLARTPVPTEAPVRRFADSLDQPPEFQVAAAVWGFHGFLGASGRSTR